MTNTQKIIIIPALGVLMLVGGGVAGYASMASAQTASATGERAGFMGMMRANGAPHVDGVITAVNGTSITITADANHGGGTYTIDASNATFTKAGASSNVSSFAVGERIWVKGTITDSNVSATTITDAPAFGGKGGHGGRGKGHGVMGTVTAVNGSSVTVTGMNGQSYTVDASAATVQKMVAGALTDIAVGDRIGVHGTVSGTTVTATTIMDDVPEKPIQ